MGSIYLSPKKQNMLKHYLPILFFLIMISPALSLLQEVPGLYIDRFSIGNWNGPLLTQAYGGFNFSLSWRYSLPGVHSTALGLYNFNSGSGKILNLVIDFAQLSTSAAIVNVNPIGSHGGIMLLDYSVVVTTQNSSNFQIINVVQSTYGESNANINVQSQKISFNSSNNFKVNTFIQWFLTHENKCENQLYWFDLYNYNLQGNSITIPFFQNDISMFKINFIIVNQEISSKGVFTYQTYTFYAGKYYDYFLKGFGVSTSLFGDPMSGHRCIHGLTALTLNCMMGECQFNAFQFRSSVGKQIDHLAFSQLYQIRAETVCYGIGNLCPSATFFNETSLSCQPCDAGCSICDSSGACSACISSTNTSCFSLSMNKTSYDYLIGREQQNYCVNNAKPWIAAIVVPTFVVIVVIICIICCKKPNQRVQNPQIESQEQLNISQGRWYDVEDEDHIIDPPICSICLGSWKGFQSQCGHFFHIECIVEWLKKKTECVLCRQSLNYKVHKMFCLKCMKRWRRLKFYQLMWVSRLIPRNFAIFCQKCGK